jgi:nucleotidyltransferase substrate binding protein (TIGR01987 family)
MTPRTLQAFRDFDSVVTRLSESLSLPTDGIVRDSAILRFKLSYEAGWKCVQAFLREEGVEAASPRQAFAGAFRLGWVKDEVIWKEILEDRNLAVHVYREALADALFERLPTYRDQFIQLVEALRPPTPR